MATKESRQAWKEARDAAKKGWIAVNDAFDAAWKLEHAERAWYKVCKEESEGEARIAKIRAGLNAKQDYRPEEGEW